MERIIGMTLWVATAAFLALRSPVLGVQRPLAETYHWENVEIVGGGFVSGILYHPRQKDLAYSRTDIGGAYRWDARKERWIPLVDFLQRPDWNLYGIESIGLDPSDPAKLYLACGTYTNEWGGYGAILRSSDQGRTFQRANMTFKMGGNMDGRSMGERLTVDPNQGKILLFGSRQGGLWRSTDGAASWSPVINFPKSKAQRGIGIGLVLFDPRSGEKGKSSKTIYAGIASLTAGLYRSNDAGDSWMPVPGQPTGMFPHHAAFDSDGSLVLTYSNAPGPNGISNGAVWRYDPKSSAWKDITPIRPAVGSGFGYAGLSIDLKHPGTMVVTTLDRWNPGDDVFRTTDGGRQWNSMRTKATMDSSGSPFLKWGQKAPKFGWWMGTVQIDPFRPGRILFGTGATIWGTDDALKVDRGQSANWTVRAQGLEETAVIDLMSPPQGAHLFSALGDVGGFKHDSLKIAPPEGMQSNPLFGNTDSIDFAENVPSVLVRVGRANGAIRRGAISRDSGQSWMPFDREPAGSRGSGHVAVSADGKAILWSPQGLDPSYTLDDGKSWNTCMGTTSSMEPIADRVRPNVFYAFDNRTGEIAMSRDSGLHFEIVGRGLPTGESLLKSVPGYAGELWLTAGKKLFRSIDSGSSFTAIKTIEDLRSIGFGKAASGRKYPTLFAVGKIGNVDGAFRSIDQGTTWVLVTDSQHGYGTMGKIIGDPRIFGRAYLGTNGRGVLYGDSLKR